MKIKQAGKKGFLLLYCALLLSVGGITIGTVALAGQQDSAAYGEIQVVQQPDTAGYRYEEKEKMDIYRGQLLLVNKDHPYRFCDPAQNLVSVYGEKNADYKVKDVNVKLDKSIFPQLNRMLHDFAAETGCKDVNIISGHRTYQYQENLLRERREEEGASADNWVAQPGASEHHTGQAIDFGTYDANGVSGTFDGKGELRWLKTNAWNYGFLMRYEEEKSSLTGIYYEPWHYRYVGIPHAAIAAKNNFCYEEYIDYLRQFQFADKHLCYTNETGSYEIYFTDSLSVPVPENAAYTLSGNNVDGFIVTVQRGGQA